MSNRSAKPRILIVGDNLDSANSLKIGLQACGCDAVSFSNPNESLDELRRHPTGFCALLSDLRLPQMNGFELARQAKKINPNVKVIAMTSFEVGVREIRAVLPNSPIDGFVAKPASIDKVRQVLFNHIHSPMTLGVKD